MSKFNLNHNQFSDLINITNNVFYPLVNFVNKDEFNSILKKLVLNNQFFPFPVFFGLNKKNFLKNKTKKKLIFYYKSKPVAKVNNLCFFAYNKKFFGKKIYGKNYKIHPYYKRFTNENYRFLSFDIIKVFDYKYEKKHFLSPNNFLKNKKIKSLVGFHTRNVPHAAHEWIHKKLIKKFKSLLIHPLIGQYKSGEYKDKTIINMNKIIVKSYKNEKIYILPFFSYPRYGGPREAALHAIVRKNYGCTHFWVGRDHAGYKDFFKKYDSQNFCKKYQKKLKIKIITEKEPYYCSVFNRIVNFCKCKKNCKINISGTEIRKMIINKKKIPKIYMKKSISKYLNINSLVD